MKAARWNRHQSAVIAATLREVDDPDRAAQVIQFRRLFCTERTKAEWHKRRHKRSQVQEAS